MAVSKQQSRAIKPRRRVCRASRVKSMASGVLRFWICKDLRVYSAACLFGERYHFNSGGHCGQKAAIEKLKNEITETQQENDEYQRLLNAGDEYEYMLSAAIERGYAYPRERRFYPKNNLE